MADLTARADLALTADPVGQDLLKADDIRAQTPDIGRDPILDAAIAALAGPVEAVAATTPN